MSKPISTQELMTSIVSSQGSGIGDLVLRAVAVSKLDDFKTAIKPYLQWYDDIAKTSLTAKYEDFASVVFNSLINDTKRHMDTWKAGIGLGMGTAYLGLEEKYMGTPQLLALYKFGQLATAFKPKLDRYWLSKYTPNLPDSRLAFKMLMEGKLSRGEFNTYALLEGWEAKWHDKLYEVYNRDPNSFLAFQMYKRGLISDTKMKECFRIEGYDDSWHTLLYLALHRVPSFRELINLADFVELPDIYIRQTLRASGYTEGDIAYITPAITKRPNREEVRSVIGRYLWEFQTGRIDRDTLSDSFTKLGLLPIEKSLMMLWGDLRYADQLLDLSTDVIEQRVVKGDITTQEDIVAELIYLGYQEEYANLLAEKWYWQHIV